MSWVRLRPDLFSRYGLLWALGILALALSLLSPYFLTTSNQMNILRQVSINAILALGMTVVIVKGGIDLSVGSLLAPSRSCSRRSCCRWRLPDPGQWDWELAWPWCRSPSRAVGGLCSPTSLYRNLSRSHRFPGTYSGLYRWQSHHRPP